MFPLVALVPPPVPLPPFPLPAPLSCPLTCSSAKTLRLCCSYRVIRSSQRSSSRPEVPPKCIPSVLGCGGVHFFVTSFEKFLIRIYHVTSHHIMSSHIGDRQIKADGTARTGQSRGGGVSVLECCSVFND